MQVILRLCYPSNTEIPTGLLLAIVRFRLAGHEQTRNNLPKKCVQHRHYRHSNNSLIGNLWHVWVVMYLEHMFVNYHTSGPCSFIRTQANLKMCFTLYSCTVLVLFAFVLVRDAQHWNVEFDLFACRRPHRSRSSISQRTHVTILQLEEFIV